MAVYGNVNVKYSYCKSVAQLKSAADYILGQRKEQIRDGVVKTSTELYTALGCNRDNFANSIIITRKMHQKRYSRFKQKEVLAHKMSISFHPEDNDKLTYKEAYRIAEEFANHFFWSKGYEVLFAVHTDTEHIHVHFLVSNCNQKNGKSFRRGPKELREMSQFFGRQCQERGLTHSVRDTFYSQDMQQEKKTQADYHIKKRDALSFKDEIKLYVRLALNDTHTKTLEDVVNLLQDVYGIDVRLKGNTISYAMPDYRSNGKRKQAVRGSRLGKKFTVAGMETHLEEKLQKQLEYKRLNLEIEEFQQALNDYDAWRESVKAEKVAETEENVVEEKDISMYEAFDKFQKEHDIPENDDEIFYGGVFDDFNKEWQGIEPVEIDEVQESEVIDYAKLSLKERAELLSEPTEDFVAEFDAYRERMGYTTDKMKSIRYKMDVYDEFMEEYEYRKKAYGKAKGRTMQEKSRGGR